MIIMNKLKLLKPDEIKKKASMLNKWNVSETHHLVGIFKFNDLAESMHFAVKVGKIAEEMHHDPEMSIGAGKVELSIYTYDNDGLTDLDFEFAIKVENLLKQI
jgi:4a-hydroxytetrahydrobiopterin dehydratase